MTFPDLTAFSDLGTFNDAILSVIQSQSVNLWWYVLEHTFIHSTNKQSSPLNPMKSHLCWAWGRTGPEMKLPPWLESHTLPKNQVLKSEVFLENRKIPVVTRSKTHTSTKLKQNYFLHILQKRCIPYSVPRTGLQGGKDGFPAFSSNIFYQTSNRLSGGFILLNKIPETQKSCTLKSIWW